MKTGNTATLTILWRSNMGNEVIWPSLPYNSWSTTLDTLHMWMQIVGKVKLALSPFLNQWWEVAFYVTPTGMTTGRIPYKNGAFAVDFNFITHTLSVTTSKNQVKTISLKPMSVAVFYKTFMNTLKALKITVSLYPVPTEFADPIPFQEDIKHASYDKRFVEKWWHIQLQASFLFDTFRTPFRGKSSPIQFFWGSFDLNGTRFSGKKVLPPKVKKDMRRIMQFAENEENFAFGFWPGDKKFPFPAFYTYMYPAPEGCETMHTGTRTATFNTLLSECILLYEDLRKTKNPEKEILHFLTTTYNEYTRLATWDRKMLEGPIAFDKVKI